MRILRAVGWRTLPCGCLIGVYETYDKKTIAMIDARAPSCRDATHKVNTPVDINALFEAQPSHG